MTAVHPHQNHPKHNQQSEYSLVHQLVPQMNGVNIHVIVLELCQTIQTMSGENIQTLKVADHSGSVSLSLRNQELIDAFQPGDILKLKNGYTNVFRGSLVLSCGRVGECLRVGEFVMPYSELPNMSEYNTQYAAMERARKGGSPPEDGEVNGDNRRGGRPDFNNKRPFNNSGGPPPKRNDFQPPSRGRP